jgi:hypothetical protein
MHDYALLFFVFFSTIIGYNFAKYFPAKKHERRILPNLFGYVKAISILSLIGLLLSCFYIQVETILISTVLSVFNFFYAMPIPNKTLREIPFLKVFIIAFIWTAVTLGFPFIETKTEIPNNALFIFEIIERFCWIILLLVPFELRDYDHDKQNLKTLATVFGPKCLKLLGITLVLILYLLRIVSAGFENIEFYSLIYLSLSLAIVFSKTKQHAYYASFWVEGLPLFWLVCWVVLK